MTTPSIALWRRARQTFEGALIVEPELRQSYLAAECAGDSELERAVEQLFASDVETGGGAPAELEGQSGRVVGGYALGEIIGRGGLGVVYLARREGVDFEQRVAVKLLNRPLEAETDRRFARERQILARLEHPGIARLIDGGRTLEGIPFLVMEWVDGEPITIACDKRQLSVEERLELFLEVAAALEYAHQSLVVHLDLKPSNVLVDAAGRTRLLDFGIAQFLDPEGENALGTRTARWLSPAYASPEQILGDPVGTASDVYSLGLLLFELLTGENPQPTILREILAFLERGLPRASDLAGRAPEVVTAARRATARTLARELAGDLDAVLAKALARQVRERYASVSALAGDVRRFLAGQSISAHRGWQLRRARRYARRQAGWVAAGVAGVGLAASVLVAATISTRRMAAERELAESERERAEIVSTALLDVFNLADPKTSSSVDPVIRQILTQAGVRIERRYGYDPVLQAALWEGLGILHHRLQELPRAEELLEKARSARREQFGAESRQYANSLALLAALRRDQGRLEAAEALARESIATYRARPVPDWSGLASAMTILGKILEARGKWEAAEALYREAFALRRGAAAPTGKQTADHHQNLAGVAAKMGELDRARAEYQQALQMIRQLPGDNRYSLLYVRNDLAALDYVQGDLAGSEAGFREVLEICSAWLGTEHADTNAARGNLAAVRQAQGEYAEAEEYFRAELESKVRSDGPEHYEVANAQGNLGNLLREAGRGAEARPLLETSLASVRLLLGESHAKTRISQNNLALALLDLGELPAARALFEEALRPTAAEGVSPGPTWLAPWIGANFAKLEFKEGHFESALARASAARAELGRTLPASHYRLAEVDGVIGAALGELGEREEAIELLEDAYQRLRATKSDAARATRETLERLAELRSRGR